VKILLIWPTGMIGENYSIFPLSLGYLKNAVEQNDSVECSILDCALEKTNSEELIAKIPNYDIIGISAWAFNIQNVQDTVDLIKKKSDATVVAGGPSAHLVKADYLVIGEGEIAFKSFAAAFLKGDFENLLKIPGVTKPDDPKTTCQFHERLDDFGIIDYDMLQLDKYIESGYKYWMYSLKDKLRSAPIIATRGCPYNCAYCQGPLLMGHRIRKHSTEYIIKTIELLYEKHSIRQISFLDDNFTFDMQYAKNLCQEIISMKETKKYDFILTSSNGIRVNRIDEELIRLMKMAGWVEIVIAPESGSPATLKRMRKIMDLDDVKKKIKLIHKYRMNAVGFFIYGYPGETKEDLNLTAQYILNSEFDRCVTHAFNPLPGTPIYDELLKSGEINSSLKVSISYDHSPYVSKSLTKSDLSEFREHVKEKSMFKEKWIKDL